VPSVSRANKRQAAGPSLCPLSTECGILRRLCRLLPSLPLVNASCLEPRPCPVEGHRRQLESESRYVGDKKAIFTDVFRFLPVPALRVLSIVCRAEERDRGSPTRCFRIGTGGRALYETPLYRHHQNNFGHPRDHQSRTSQRKCFLSTFVPDRHLEGSKRASRWSERVLVMRSFWMGGCRS